MLRVEKLKVGALPPLSFELPPGECLAIEGPSGSGKSRLLRAIADLDPAPGYIYLEAIERREMSGPDWRRRVRYVATEPGWWAPTPRAHVPQTAAGKLERLMSGLGLGVRILDRPVSELSTGERQRLAFARALLDDAKVLLLDEPCASLDAQSSALIEEQIRFQTLAGRSIILVSHVESQIERLAHARLQLAKADALDTAAGGRS